MNIHTKKQKIKLLLLLLAFVIAISSTWYSVGLVKKLSQEERKKVELWAKALNEMLTEEQISPTISLIIENNSTIPVMLVDANDRIIVHRNFPKAKANDTIYLKKQLQSIKKAQKPIVVEFLEGHKNYVYYKESILLTQLFYYPFIQIGVVVLFLIVSYLAFNSSRKAEENQLWVGMSKETAHQLGTPISSLIAWIELLKMKNENPKLIKEVSKDVKRLETITERFSRIGSEPNLAKQDLTELLKRTLSYLKSRTSKKVIYKSNFNLNEEILIPLNNSLFEWVIENLIKNAIDAMSGKGFITVEINERREDVILDISDTGKGISKSNQRNVFKAGFTTKKRGWGLGLSLAKRIIEVYHSGKIFIKNSEIGKGTTFRIILKK